MLVTQSTLDALRTTVEMRFSAAYGATETWYDKVSTTIPSTTAFTTYAWVAQQLRMREWIGPRTAQNLSEHSYTITNKDFESTVEVDRNEIEDDNLGLFTSVIIPQLAQAAKKHPDILMQEMLQSNSGAGPTAFDGLLLFDDSHPTFGVTTTTYDNKFSLALTADNFNTNYVAMTQYKGEDDQLLGVRPTHLIVPSSLKRTALELMNGTMIAQAVRNVAGAENVAAAAIDNALKGWCEVLEIPELNNDPTRWYLADLSKPLKPLILQLRRPDQFVSRDNMLDPKVFDQKKFTYGVDNRKAVGVSLPFLISTSKP